MIIKVLNIYNYLFLQVSLGMGFIVCTLATTLGGYGGAHMNPAVSLSMTVCAKITVLRGKLINNVIQHCRALYHV